MSGDNHSQADRLDVIGRAMDGVGVWIGFRDEAGDDDFASGTLDRDSLRQLARAILRDPAAVAAIRGEVSS